jgi:hypothetical protein
VATRGHVSRPLKGVRSKTPPGVNGSFLGGGPGWGCPPDRAVFLHIMGIFCQVSNSRMHAKVRFSREKCDMCVKARTGKIGNLG